MFSVLKVSVYFIRRRRARAASRRGGVGYFSEAKAAARSSGIEAERRARMENFLMWRVWIEGVEGVEGREREVARVRVE